MTYNRYFFNRGLWWYAFRKTGWVGIIYLLGLIMALPFGVIRKENEPFNLELITLNHLYEVTGNLQIIIILAFPAIIAVLLSHYMHSRKAVDLFHSLPLQRHHLLTSCFGIGTFILLIPVWIVALIMVMLRPGLSIISFTNIQILQWATSTSVIVLLIFTFTMLVGIWVGQSLLQLVVAAGILLLPAMLSSLLNKHMKEFLYGYIGSVSYYDNPSFWSPVLKISILNIQALQATVGWIYLGITILCVILSYWFYKIRPSEGASQSVVFRYFNPFFRFFMMLILSLTTGNIFTIFIVDNRAIMITGYIIGALLGGIIAEMIIAKSWNIINTHLLRVLGGYGVLTAIILFTTASSVNGFESKIPAEHDIQRVYMGNNVQNEIFDYVYAPNGQQLESTLNSNYLSNEASYIQAILNLHTKIEQMRPNEGLTNNDFYGIGGDQRWIQIAYQLKDGSLMTRAYTIPFRDYQAYILPVINHISYKNNYYSLYKLADYEGTITINNPDLISSNSSEIVISDPEEVNELKQLIIENIKLEEDPWHKQPVGNSLELYASFPLEGTNESYNMQKYSWEPSDKKLGDWLKEKNLLDLTTKPTDIKSIDIVKMTSQINNLRSDETFAENAEGVTTVKNLKDITELLDNSQANYMEVPNSHMLRLNFKSGKKAYRQLTNENTTSEIYTLLPR